MNYCTVHNRYGLDVLRLDFNIGPAPFWAAKDAAEAKALASAWAAEGRRAADRWLGAGGGGGGVPGATSNATATDATDAANLDKRPRTAPNTSGVVGTDAASPVKRTGMAELKYITGLYALWDGILAKHPGLLIDDCSSGGRRIDVGTLARSVSLAVLIIDCTGAACAGSGCRLLLVAGCWLLSAAADSWLTTDSQKVVSSVAVGLRRAHGRAVATARHHGTQPVRTRLVGRRVWVRAKKSGNIFRVGIFLDFVWLTTRTPHRAYVRRARRNRIDRHGGGIERLTGGTRTTGGPPGSGARQSPGACPAGKRSRRAPRTLPS